MTKLSVCSLLAVAVAAAMCSSVDPRQKKMKEISIELNKLSKSLQQDGPLLNTPSAEIDECCFLSALSCFRDQMQEVQVKITKNILKQKISNNLKSKMLNDTVNSTCIQYGVQGTKCTACESHPKKSSKEFIKELEALMQKTFVRLAGGEK